MRNVWLVLKRDILRLLNTPPALVVVLFLVVLTSIYTRYNVAAWSMRILVRALSLRGSLT